MANYIHATLQVVEGPAHILSEWHYRARRFDAAPSEVPAGWFAVAACFPAQRTFCAGVWTEWPAMLVLYPVSFQQTRESAEGWVRQLVTIKCEV